MRSSSSLRVALALMQVFLVSFCLHLSAAASEVEEFVPATETTQMPTHPSSLQPRDNIIPGKRSPTSAAAKVAVAASGALEALLRAAGLHHGPEDSWFQASSQHGFAKGSKAPLPEVQPAYNLQKDWRGYMMDQLGNRAHRTAHWLGLHPSSKQTVGERWEKLQRSSMSLIDVTVGGFGSTDLSTNRSLEGRPSELEFQRDPPHTAATESHRRSFEVAQTDASNTSSVALYRYIPSDYCLNGAVAVKPDTVLLCPSSAGTIQVTATDFLSLPVSTQAACAFQQNGSVALQCICSNDFRLGTPLFGRPRCVAQNLECTSKIVSPVKSCGNQSVNEPAVDPICYTTTRNSQIRLSVNVSCRFQYVQDTAYQAFGVSMGSTTQVANIVYVTLPAVRNGVNSTVARRNAVIPNNGTYRELETTSFRYVDTKVDGSLRLTAAHPARINGTLFAQMYNFRRISDKSQVQSQPVASSPAQTLSGAILVDYTVDLSAVPSDFLTGGRMYLETGLSSPLVGSSNIAADHFFIDFSDYIPPPTPVALSNATTIVLIVLGVVAGLGLLILLAVCVRRKRQRLEVSVHEDSDDEDE